MNFSEKSLTIGSALAAFAASLCCLGPLLLGGIGLGAVLVATFAPLRPYFLAVSAGLLALGFYSVYRRPKAAEACDGQVCATDNWTRRMAKPLLWLAAVAVAALALFPIYGAKLVGTSKAAAPVASARLETVNLKITGMVCEVCASGVQHKLAETPGVVEAQVQYPAGRATVKYDPTKTEPAKLIEAVSAAGYKASVVGLLGGTS